MTFTGKALYDSGAMLELEDDVSSLITMLSPRETPLLDILSPPERAATNVLHEWLEDELSPNTVISSTNVSTAGTALGVHASGKPLGFLRPGAQLKNTSTGEYLQVTAISGNTITVTRQFGSTSMSTIAAGASLFVVAPAKLEGFDVTVDGSQQRERKSNYVQLYGYELIVSGTQQAVSHIGVADEYEHQKMKKMQEALRDLEKSVIQGKLSGNTIGSSTAYRTMKGLWDFLETNISSVATLTPSLLDGVIESAWSEGGVDCDYIVASPGAKKLIDSFNESRTRVTNMDSTYRDMVSVYEGTFGSFKVIMSRWMPTNGFIVMASDRVKVVPLRDREFQHKSVAPTGDAVKGMIVGEYTLEVRGEKQMAKGYF